MYRLLYRFLGIALCAWFLVACADEEPAQVDQPVATATVTALPPTPTVSPLPTATSAQSLLGQQTALTSPIPSPTPTAIPVYGYRVIERYPHDASAFTQGLIYVDGEFYEGTGRTGQSTLRRVDLESGEVTQMIRLPDQLFGEGITLFDNRILQLTWTTGIGFIYDRASFELLGTFTYNTEGWGLTHDGESLIMSDGSNRLTYLDPQSVAPLRQIAVSAAGEPVMMINELEYIDGFIYANIWQTDRIAKIDPERGDVVAWIDLSGLFPPEDRSETQAVLNGIAHDAENDRLFVTGKLWPWLFWIELTPPAQP